MGGDGSNWPEHSSRIMDIKKSREAGLRYFEKIFAEIIKKPYFAIAVVPSHDPASVRSGLHILVSRINKNIGAVDGGDYLIRTKKIEKLATGGNRALSIHLDSMAANNAARFKNRRIMLLDDVLTSGNSMVAGRKVLLEAGAGDVTCIALSQTTY